VFPYESVIELNSLTVYPSARVSHRVPFGTGRAQQNYLERNECNYPTYNFNIFQELKSFFKLDFLSDQLLDCCSEPLRRFLVENDFYSKINEIRSNTNGRAQFYRRFFKWFYAFMVLKYVHFARDHYYANEDIVVCCSKLLRELNIETDPHSDAIQLLGQFRAIQKQEDLKMRAIP
jgi:hypothetical protein